MPEKLVKRNTTSGSTTAPGDSATLNNPRYNSAREEAMYNYVRGRGVGAPQAAGLMGNLAVESYLNADLKQVGGPAYGLMQAEGPRQKAYRTYNEVPYAFGSKLTPEEQQQLDYIIDKGLNTQTSGEWRHGKGFNGAAAARQAFLGATDAQKASDIFTNNFLRPSKPHLQRRRAMTSYFDSKYNKSFPNFGNFMWNGPSSVNP